MSKNLFKYFLVGVLGICVGVGIMSFSTKLLKQNNQEYKPIIDGSENKDKDISQEEITEFIEQFTLNFNGETKDLSIKFNLEKEENESYSIIGRFNDEIVYKESYGETGKASKEIFSKDRIRIKFSKNNFKIIQGADGLEYLAVVTYDYNDYNYGIGNSLINIYNKQLEKVNQEELIYATPSQNIELVDGIEPWYYDEFSICKRDCQIRGRILEDRILLLSGMASYDDEENFLEERIYTFMNNTLNFTINKKYRIKTNLENQ